MECGAPYVMTSGVLDMQRSSVDNWVYPLQVGRYTIVEVFCSKCTQRILP